MKYHLLLSLIFLGCFGSKVTNNRSVVTINGIKCVQPPKEFLEESLSAETNNESRIGVILNANFTVERKVQELIKVIPTTQAFEITSFNSCVDYADGRITKEQYNERADIILPLVLQQIISNEE